MPKKESIRQKNSAAILATINQLPEKNYDTVALFIPQLLTEGHLVLDHSAYPPADCTTTEAKGIGRYLIYDHKDTENPFSIWAFALAPRQKTSIHDHQYEGTVTVLAGPVSEKYYQPTMEQLAKRIGRVDRYRFHKNSDDLNDPFVHQLKRRKGLGEGVSVTLHIYKMTAHLIEEDRKIEIDRRNLKNIYYKDRHIKPDSSAYEEKYQEAYSAFQPK